MATVWNRDLSGKVRCLLMVLLVLMSTPATRAQDGQVPTVITRVPIDVTGWGATLRAEVNPNGLPTEVEFFVDKYNSQWTACGKVSAGSGTTPVLVQLEAHDFPDHGFGAYRLEARASNAAGTSTGYKVQFELPFRDPFSHSPRYLPADPIIALISVTNITERSATVEVEVNPMGATRQLVVSVGAEYVLGEWDREVRKKRTLKGVSHPVRLKFEITGLWRGFTYKAIRGQVESHWISGAYSKGYLEGPSLTTLGEPGHNPPEFPNVAIRVPIEANRSFSLAVEPFDPDSRVSSIETASQPQHGTVSVDGMKWTYTPDSTYDGTDQFSVTAVDSTGERTTRMVQIYDKRPRAFEFELPLKSDVSAPSRPAGTLKLSTTVTGAFTGKISIFGVNHTLRGNFDQFDQAVVNLPRAGAPPVAANLQLAPGVDGGMHLSAHIHGAALDSSYVAEGLPVGDAETSEGVAGLQYTAVLPMREGAVEDTSLTTRSNRVGTSDTPQGDGFFIGKVDRNGRARFTGRTGDGQTFAIGGRLQRDRQLQVGISAGKQPRDYIVGNLEFNRDETRSLGGSLAWLSYRSQQEYYVRDFSRVAEPEGAAYRKPKAAMNLFGEAGGSSELRVKLLDDAGVPLVDSIVSVNQAGSASLSSDYSLELQFDVNSGLFHGTLKGADLSAKTTFMGALVQPLKRGHGHLLLNGPVGAAMIEAPEQ